MHQEQTLNEAQLRRVLHYCCSRRHPVRGQTIVMVSFYAGLRAKQIAALKVDDVFDEDGNVREQFILSAVQSKGGKTRTVYLSQRLRRSLSEYGATISLCHCAGNSLLRSSLVENLGAQPLGRLIQFLKQPFRALDMGLRDSKLPLQSSLFVR